MYKTEADQSIPHPEICFWRRDLEMQFHITLFYTIKRTQEGTQSNIAYITHAESFLCILFRDTAHCTPETFQKRGIYNYLTAVAKCLNRN